MFQWLHDNPLLALMIWGVFTSVLSFVYQKLDGIPRVHAVLAILVAMGFDLKSILTMLKRVFFGGDPPAGSANGGSGLKVVGSALLVLAMGAVVVGSTTGCTPAEVAVVKTITGDLVTICNALDTQPEPALVVIGCDVVDGAGQVISNFQVKKSKAEAPAFLKAHAKRVAKAETPHADMLESYDMARSVADAVRQ